MHIRNGMIQNFIKLDSASITEKIKKNENRLHRNIFCCSLLHHFGCESSLSFEKKIFLMLEFVSPAWPKLKWWNGRTKLPENFLNPYRTEKNSSLQDCSGFSEPLRRARIFDEFAVYENAFLYYFFSQNQQLIKIYIYI